MSEWNGTSAKQLAQGQAPASATTVYTQPGSTSSGNRTNITNIVLCNTDASARTVTMYVCKNGATTSAANAIFSAMSIAASTSIINDFQGVGIVIESGGFIAILADSAAKVTYTISGVEL